MKRRKTKWLGSVGIHEILEKEFLGKILDLKVELQERFRGNVKALKGKERYIVIMGITWIDVMRVGLL